MSIPSEPWRAPVVVPIDSAGARERAVRDRAERASVEDGRADALGLEQTVHTPHERVCLTGSFSKASE